MIQKVLKRDGRTVDFNFTKIEEAIRKAMHQTEHGIDAVLAAQVAEKVTRNSQSVMSVEAIQDAVEMELMNSPRKEVAKAYIAYRNARSVARRAKTK
ncbi:MAG: ATP cone domain-containing protein, partial [Bacteroidales bacterium]